MPRSNRDDSIEVGDGETYCTVTLEGEPQITELIWAAIKAVAPPRLIIARGGAKLQESRTPGLVGIRYANIIYHTSDLPES